MPTMNDWTRQQLLVAFNLYCQIPFGKMHSRNPQIVKYSRLIHRSPSALAMKLTNIASLDPAITLTGRKGLPGASKADKAMWDEMQADWERFAVDATEATEALSPSADGSDVLDIPISDEEADFTGSNRTIQTTARIGQALFRRSVLSAYDYRCCITGLNVPKLLVASHIIPWRSEAKHRLNPRNGLCLSMLHDRAFDIGILTIAEDMTVSISKKCAANNNTFFASTFQCYDGKAVKLPEKFLPDEQFLAYHRKHIFESQEFQYEL
jgi:putative restriction endonuclease